MNLPATIAGISLCLLTACSAAPQAVPDDVPAWRKDVSFAEASQVGWQRVDETFGRGFHWRVGDSSLYALTRYDRGDVERRLIEIEIEALAPTFTDGEHWNHIFFFHDKDGKTQSLRSMSMKLRVTISDEKGKEISSDVCDVPEAYLRLGFFDGCQVGARLRDYREYRKDEQGNLHLRAPSELYEAVASLQALFAVVASSNSLRPILEDVVEKPSLLVLIPALLAGSISISVAPDFMAAEKTGIPDHPDVDGYSFPITFSINDRPGLYTRVLVSRPEELAPLAGGVVTVEGRHPRNKDIWMSLRLLGSRRGPTHSTR